MKFASGPLAGEFYRMTPVGMAISGIWYLKDSSPEFLTRVARALVPAHFSPKEVIQKEGSYNPAQAAVDDPTNQTKKLAMVSMVRLPRSAAPAAQ